MYQCTLPGRHLKRGSVAAQPHAPFCRERAPEFYDTQTGARFMIGSVQFTTTNQIRWFKFLVRVSWLRSHGIRDLDNEPDQENLSLAVVVACTDHRSLALSVIVSC